jgi:aspartate aminotransferase
MQLSKLSKIIGDSPTLMLDAKAKQLAAAASPVIHLGGGEPHSLTPPNAVRAGIEKLKSGKIKYTKTGGTPEIKKAVINHTKQIYGKTLGMENILISNGAKQAIFNFLLAAVNAQDEVIFPAPYWVSYPEMVKLCGGTAVIVKPPQNSFEPDFKDIQAAVTPKTKAILINSPNNPSGAVYSNKFIESVVHFCETEKIYLLMDDIYRQLVFDGIKPAVCYDYCRNSDNIIVINGVSKAYGMTGFRIGWALANEKLIKAMTKMQAQTVSCPSDLSQVCVAAALNSGQKCVDELVSQLQENRNILLGELSKIKKAKAVEPQGTFYCLADFAAYDKDSNRLAQFLIEKAMVVTIPGRGFGMDGHLRLSYCGSKEDVLKGVRRIRFALDEPQNLKMD